MRVLIAGWHGQVARALIERAPSLPEIKALAAGRPALDVRDPRSIERAFGDISPSIVINTAAYTAVDDAERDAGSAFALNRDGARLLAQAAARRNVPIIHLSTHYVFDGAKPSPYDETDAPAPATVYGRSKLEGENAVREANPRHIVLRTSWVFSRSGRNFVTRILAGLEEGAPLRVVADQHGNPTFAPDLAAAVLEVARQVAANGDATPWGTYHAAASGATSWHGLACEVLACRARRGRPAAAEVEAIATSEYATGARRPLNAELDCRRLADTFSIRLPPWQDGVAACVAAMEER